MLLSVKKVLMNMFTVKRDDESQSCWICGGPRVHPFPCHRGCAEPSLVDLIIRTNPIWRKLMEGATLDMLMDGVGLPVIPAKAISLDEACKLYPAKDEVTDERPASTI